MSIHLEKDANIKWDHFTRNEGWKSKKKTFETTTQMTFWTKTMANKRVHTQDNGGKQVKQNLVWKKQCKTLWLKKDCKSQVSCLVKCGCLVGKTNPIIYPLLIHVKTCWDTINLTLFQRGIACSRFNAPVSLTTYSELSPSIHRFNICWMVSSASHSPIKYFTPD